MQCESNAEYSYFLWLINKVHANRYLRRYENAFRHLHEMDYVWTHMLDEDRAKKGVYLRLEFEAESSGLIRSADYSVPCSMLELMISLAIDCDERLMWNSDDGDRSDRWFWNMFCNLGLQSMHGNKYDPGYLEDRVLKFIVYDYPPNGDGSLFWTDRDDIDMREQELWYQMMYWLSAAYDI